MDDFEAWYEREHPRVLATCVALGGRGDVARDATDEAFARALERWPKVRAMDAPGGWVQVVAINHLRRSQRRARIEDRLLRRSAPADPPVAAIPDRELWMVVAHLPHRQQTAVVLRYVHGLPEAAIATAMGVARGTVASTLHAAHAGLRRLLADPLTLEEPIHG